MIALAASAFPWPGHQNPPAGLLPEHRIQVLLLRANDFGFRAKNLRKTLPLTRKVERDGMCSTIRAGRNSRGTGFEQADLIVLRDAETAKAVIVA
jgi:hypothetical protein